MGLYRLSISEVLDFLVTYVKTNKIKTTFKDDRSGDAWFINVCSQNKISIKKPQGVSRKTQENLRAIYVLKNTIAELYLEGKADQILNNIPERSQLSIRKYYSFDVLIYVRVINYRFEPFSK